MSSKKIMHERVPRAVVGPRGPQPKFLHAFYVHPYKIKPYFLFLCVDLFLGRYSFFPPLPSSASGTPVQLWGCLSVVIAVEVLSSFSGMKAMWYGLWGSRAGWECRYAGANSVPTLWHEAEEYGDRWANITLHSQLNFVSSVFIQIVTCKEL